MYPNDATRTALLDVDNMPLNDAVGTVVLGSDARNVDTVFVAGQVRKWGGRLLGVDLPALGEEARASRDHVVAAADRAARG
ncbi:hypothetical protein [Streptomyces sp. NPDC048272]|uniref:hypothetical protein n=1 Tax=Streptomyces sp. NPDC048272 TaxID=3154616 RepID=UPI00343B64ED